MSTYLSFSEMRRDLCATHLLFLIFLENFAFENNIYNHTFSFSLR